jgi:hypothetical protein
MDPVIRRARYILRQSAALLAAAEENDGVPFQHALSPPEEFREPDLSRTRQLDREQEAQGLDQHRRVEDVGSVGIPARG